MRCTLTLIPAAILCLSALSSPAQTWEKINPAGVVAIDWLAVDAQDVVTLSGGGGTFWSADQGKSWKGGTPITAPVKILYKGAEATGNSRFAFAAHPDGDLLTLQLVIAGGKLAASLFISTDHGFNWTNTIDSLPGQPNGFSYGMLCAPDGYVYVFISTKAVLFDKMFVSKDKGKTFEEAKGGLINHSLCAADPDGKIYCAGYKAGANKISLYRSADHGAAWDSLYSNNSIAAIAANQKGGVAMAIDRSVAAMFPGDASVKTGTVNFGAGTPTAVAMAPDKTVLLGLQYSGVQKSNTGLDQTLSLNDGLGTDTGAIPRQFQYDSKGNLYLRTGQNVYLMKGTGSGLRPVAAGKRGSGSSRLLDAEGRKVGAKRHAHVWSVAAP